MLRVFWIFHGIIWLAIFVFFTASVFASSVPDLISPSDNAREDKSPKLSWEYQGVCDDSGSCFRVEIDNNADFSSPEKSSYAKSKSYSPQGLAEGTYYWRVKAKDNSGNWSVWSNVFKFHVGSTSLPSSDPTPQASVTSNPTHLPSKQVSLFEVKDLPAVINSDQEIEVSVLIHLDNRPNQKFYLKGAFRKKNSSNYFGFTLIGDEWVKNGVTYSSQFPVEIDSESKWEGKIKIKADSEDSGFNGSGEYVFKIGRYTDSGAGPIWSNEVALKINEVEVPEPSPSSDEPEEYIEEEFEEDSGLEISRALPSRAFEIKIASVAGEATMSNNMPLVDSEEQTRVLEEKRVNWLLVFLGFGILVGGIGFGVYKFRR